MKKIVMILLMGTCSCAPIAYGQKLISDQPVPVKNYDIRQAGYPLAVVPGDDGQFIYLQYWLKDDSHATDSYYLQCLKNVNYEGLWYEGVTPPGIEEIKVSGMHRLEKSVVVTGTNYLPKLKADATVGRFFQLDGESMGYQPIQFSTYQKKPSKDFKETFHISPNKKCILWTGRDDKQLLFSAFDALGEKMWAESVDLSPWTGKRYAVKQTLVDDDGSPYILLGLKKPTYSMKDTLYPPVLLHFTPSEEAIIGTFHADTMKLDSAFVVEMKAEMIGKNELVIGRILGQENPGGLSNGALTDGDPVFWNQIGITHYQWEDSLFTVHADSISPIPSAWPEQYGVEGSNFSESRLLVQNDRGNKRAVWVFEEIYQVKKRMFFYDLACFGLNLTNGTVRWASRIEKRQRSESGHSLLSYTSAMTKWGISFLYLSERGARGKLVCSTMDLGNGKRTDKWLASNEAAQYLFFPRQSAKVSEREVVLIGMGNPGQNDYKLMTILLD